MKKIHKLFFLITCSICLLFFLFAMDFFFLPLMINFSDEIAIYLQSFQNQTIDLFLQAITNICEIFVMTGVGILFFEFSSNKLRAIYIIMVSIFSTVIINIMKNLYMDPRPYMRNSKIKAIGNCALDWGNPSGHAFNGLVFYFLLFFIFIKYIWNKKPPKKIIKKVVTATSINSNFDENLKSSEKIGIMKMKILKLLMILFFLMIFVFFLFLVSISRIYFGFHSINQILTGLICGTILLILHYQTYTKIISCLESFYARLKIIVKCFIIIMVQLFFFMVFFILFLFISNYNEINFEILEKIETECGISNKNEFLFSKSFVDSANIGILFGFLVGMLFQSQKNLNEFFDGTYIMNFKKNYAKLPFFKKFARILALAIIIGGTYFLFNIFSFKENIYLMFFRNYLRNFLCSFFLIKFAPQFFFYLKLEVHGDVFKFSKN